MSRPIWKGSVSFGLVNVPVVLYSAERRADISFKLIDSRNTARIRYDRVNEETGEEVPWDRIVKGFEYDDHKYVLLSKEELENVSVEMTRMIEIEQFVDVEQIKPLYFDKPYYLVPGKGGEKGYVLLREAMAEAGKVGISQVVIRTRQYLAALMPEDDALLLILLRFQQEIRDITEHEIPSSDLRKYKITKKEIELAGQLINGMTQDWQPEAYHNDYHAAVMELINKKIKAGQFEAIAVEEQPEEDEQPQTVNMMDVLKASVEQSAKRKIKTSKKQSSPQTKKTKKKAS